MNHSVDLIFMHWFSEGQTITKQDIISFQEDLIGIKINFFNLVWSTVAVVGCGMTKSKSSIILVCHFAPVKAVAHAEVFKIGAPASRCPDEQRPNSKFPNLCGEFNYSYEPHWDPPFVLTNAPDHKINFIVLLLNVFMTNV